MENTRLFRCGQAPQGVFGSPNPHGGYLVIPPIRHLSTLFKKIYIISFNTFIILFFITLFNPFQKIFYNINFTSFSIIFTNSHFIIFQKFFILLILKPLLFYSLLLYKKFLYYTFQYFSKNFYNTSFTIYFILLINTFKTLCFIIF